MNAFRPNAAPTTPIARALAAPPPVRHTHRERDFGIGYGNSSGYASNRRYTRDWAQPRFRCA
ncbi:hypothetical protein ACFOLC_12945 [Lysobacter cavernae]|uniref:Uncharacterized protein n=1 Tax=Lysobacter cavernae TaxID=1685901 RepID=A0ABV7RQX5_9GAMM